MERMAFLFPGQGVQFPGMGNDLVKFRFAQEVFEVFKKITKKDISNLSADELKQTMIQQPAITAVSLAVLRILQQKGISPTFVAGNSLGEYSALTAAEVISWQDCLKIVAMRGALMQREAEKNPGVMYVVNGLEIELIQSIIRDVKEKGEGYANISIANYNTKTQIVISGEPKPVILAAGMAQEKGAKIIPLKRVNDAWHSDLMLGAVTEFREFLHQIYFYPPVTPVFHNLTATREKDPNRIREIMIGQICHRVRWYEIILEMIKRNVRIFVEIGPDKVLTGLLGNIIPTDYHYQTFNICTLEEIKKFEKSLK